MKRLAYSMGIVALTLGVPNLVLASHSACDAVGRCVTAGCVAVSLANCFGGWLVSVWSW